MNVFTRSNQLRMSYGPLEGALTHNIRQVFVHTNQ